MASQYEPDEFDQIAPGGPQGVHRKKHSPWRNVLPFLAVLLIVPLLAWGATAIIKGRGPEEVVVVEVAQSQVDEPQSEAAPIEPLDEDGPTGVPDDLDGEEQAPEEVTPEAPAADLNAAIIVLNASGTDGLAGANAEVLSDAGFTNTTAGNADSSATTVNTVYYADASLLPTAQRVGELLGISELSENASAVGDYQIAVLLRTVP